MGTLSEGPELKGPTHNKLQLTTKIEVETKEKPVGLLHTTSSRCTLSRGLGCELLTGGFSSRGFTGGLLGASHGVPI